MKKLTIAILIICIMIPFSGCSKGKMDASVEDALNISANILGVTEKQASVTDTDKGSILALRDVHAMFRSCGQLVSYLAVSSYDVDMQDISAEDFWLILSLVTYAEKPELVGEFGTIDLEYDVVSDIAEAFFSEILSSSGLPAPKDIYSASYVAAEKLYELQPVSISDVEAELTSLEPTDASGSQFLMQIKLVDRQNRIRKAEWNVSLESWDDEVDHFFPYKFVKAWYVD